MRLTPNRLSVVPMMCLLLGAGQVAAVTQDQIYGVLEKHGIPFDREAAEKGAVVGLLKSIDEGARIIAMDEPVPVVTNRTLQTAEEWGEGICYVKLGGLCRGGGAETVRLLRAWATTGRAGMIMDIRGAGGDDIKSVDDIGAMFGRTNSLLYTVRSGRGEILESHHVKKDSLLGETPLMVLVDGDTVGACELLAATLRGRKGVMLVGSRTGGDAGIRENMRLSDNEILYIATRWLVPASEVEYDRVGVKPDITMSPVTAPRTSIPDVKRIGKRPSEKDRTDRELMERVAGDAVLARATDILLGLKALRRTDEQKAAQDEGRVPDGPE